jgi:hypothetical protein
VLNAKLLFQCKKTTANAHDEMDGDSMKNILLSKFLLTSNLYQ